MRILVVEDKEMHRVSARETLADHEVTIVGSFDEAMNFMGASIDRAKFRSLLAAGKNEDEAYRESMRTFNYEVVLTDMMMPMSQQTLSPGIFDPSAQVPYGFIIALKATLYGAKYVAMVTDTNHHASAISAAIDYLGSESYPRVSRFEPNFIINGAKVSFVHTPFMKDGKSKDWGRVLQDLTAD